MLCDFCAKNQASVHLTEIIDGQMTELHLCEDCARQKSAAMEQQFGLSDLLAGMADFSKPAAKEAEAAAILKCPNCGLSYTEFKKVGRLGCSECYAAFRKYLLPLLKRIHGSSQHIGKSISRPAATRGDAKGDKKKPDLAQLRARLARAVEAEEFEEAAKLRDLIKEMERKQNAA
jgi:protein arginine kinase activator